MQETENQEFTLDLRRILYPIFRARWKIIFSACICALLIFIYKITSSTPMYCASTDIFILNSNVSNNLSYNDLQTSTQLTGDYEQLILNSKIMEEVVDRMGLKMPANALASKISVRSDDDTHILSINVVDSDPYVARNIANMVREVAATRIVEIMNIDAVNTINEATIPTSRTSSGASRTAIIIFLVVIVAGSVAAVLLELMNDTVKTPDDVAALLGLSTLGSIPLIKQDGKHLKSRKGARS